MRFTAALTLLTTLLILAGCAHHPEQERLRAEQDAAQRFAAQGYQARRDEAVNAARHRLSLGGVNTEFELLTPKSARKAALIVYLPGLGEAPQAGELWRMAWARAGYAVLSVQLLADDANAWQSELARTGEFSALGRQRFADAAMLHRLQALTTVLQQASREAADPVWKAVDLSAIALAGFDLGAYTAMVAAGEQLPGQAAPTLPMPVTAVLALSPYAQSGAGADRYRALRMPVLSVTASQDFDPLDLMPDTRLRRQPFEQMPTPDKYLLALAGGGHALLAGNPQLLKERASREAAGGEHRGGGRQGGSQGGPPGGGGMGGHKGGRRGGGGGEGGPEQGNRTEQGQRPSANMTLLSSAVQSVSTAFLDAYLGREPAARQWLDSSADSWLAGQARLQHK
nr:hypothetical protein [uncultured Roseateles sp.]